MILPPRWDRDVLQAESKAAIKVFRDERLLEPLQQWTQMVEDHQTLFSKLFSLHGLPNPSRLTPEIVSDLFRAKFGDALRYLVGPPISKADLQILAETSLAPRTLSRQPEAAKRVLDIIKQALDAKRFPWVAEGRAPTKEEEAAAVLASAVLITSQRMSTKRRTEGKDAQEASVKRYLVERMDFRAPDEGCFCGESRVGTRKADIVARLFDGRVMPIELQGIEQFPEQRETT